MLECPLSSEIGAHWWRPGISRVIPLNSGSSSQNLFDVQYQLRLNDLYNLTSTDLIYYSTAMEYLSTLSFVLTGFEIVRFNRYTNKLYLDIKWGYDVKEGDYIIVEAYRGMDPEQYARMWGDAWLKKYTCALFKRQWGANGKKFSGIQLPGGVTMDWGGIYDEAVSEINELEDELMNKQAPLSFFVG